MQRFAAAIACSLALTSTALANNGESSFTPSSLYVPVRDIMLMSSTSNLASQLYRCPTEPDPRIPLTGGTGGSSAGTGGAHSTVAYDGDAGMEVLNDDCLVDMADNAALEALFTDQIDIKPGTYDQIVVGQCRAGDHGYSSYVRGSIELSGQTWFTTSGDGTILTLSQLDNRYVQLDYAGCGSTIPLPAPVTLKSGDVVNISAFFSLKNIAWATLTNNGPPGGCAFDPHGHNVCTGYPIPIAYIGGESPKLDTYYITEDTGDEHAAKAGGQMLLLRAGASGPAFGGFSRRLLSATSVTPSVNYDTPLKTVMLNPDGATYMIENYGGGSNGVAVPYYVHFPAFQLQTHAGTMTRSDGVTMVDYRAVLQP
jgi:hypothetical protein